MYDVGKEAVVTPVLVQWHKSRVNAVVKTAGPCIVAVLSSFNIWYDGELS